jgi:hypothetical protein
MKKLSILSGLLLACGISPQASAENIHARLIGYQEVPSVSTVARGEFVGQISPDDQFIDYELTFSGLQGDVRQAHIHVGQKSVSGGVVIWLCQTSFNQGPAGTQTCPQSGTIRGTIRASDVVAITGVNASQQIAAGELAEVLAAIRAGVAYANVHTNLSTGGEIRGQIRASRRDKD